MSQLANLKNISGSMSLKHSPQSAKSLNLNDWENLNLSFGNLSTVSSIELSGQDFLAGGTEQKTEKDKQQKKQMQVAVQHMLLSSVQDQVI